MRFYVVEKEADREVDQEAEAMGGLEVRMVPLQT